MGENSKLVDTYATQYTSVTAVSMCNIMCMLNVHAHLLC